jgi:ABC-type dipeptide/oligopeptide/nickel transport system ATPase component
MNQILAIIGRPGTGKSALIRRLMRRTSDWRDWSRKEGSVTLKGHVSSSLNLRILGDYSDPNETFPGTDRLSMAIAPVAVRWMKTPGMGNFIFEGDRLGNASTLRLLSLHHDIRLRVYCLTAPDWMLQQRYMLRGSAQSAQVLRARETKIANICCNPNLLVRMRENKTSDQLERLVDDALAFFRGEKA